MKATTTIILILSILCVIIGTYIEAKKENHSQPIKKEFTTTHQLIDSVVVKAGTKRSIIFIYSRIVK